METIVYAVLLTTYNFDDCDSSYSQLVSIHFSQKGAIISAEKRVSGWCNNVQWNKDKTIGKVDITGELTIEEIKMSA